MISYNVVTKASQLNEPLLSNRLRPKQGLGKRKLSNIFLEEQARYETELSQQATAAVQQHALEEKAYYEARVHHLEANFKT